jgi:hypothetical protein
VFVRLFISALGFMVLEPSPTSIAVVVKSADAKASMSMFCGGKLIRVDDSTELSAADLENVDPLSLKGWKLGPTNPGSLAVDAGGYLVRVGDSPPERCLNGTFVDHFPALNWKLRSNAPKSNVVRVELKGLRCGDFLNAEIRTVAFVRATQNQIQIGLALRERGPGARTCINRPVRVDVILGQAVGARQIVNVRDLDRVFPGRA